MPSKQPTSRGRDGPLARAPRKKRSPAARVGRLVRKLLGLPRAQEAALPARPGEDAVFEHLWRTAAAASDYRQKLSIHQPNVLLFQMGKVASLALEAALIDGGVNCFHCHYLAHETEMKRLSSLFESAPDFRLAAIDLKLLARHTALNMLVRWHRGNAVAPGRRLKVVTLTRDPVTWYVSQFLQRVGHDPKSLTDWHNEFTDRKGESGDVRAAAGELLRRVARLIVETRPSRGPAAARALGRTLAMAMTPPQPFIAANFQRALVPLDWFDKQFTPLIGIDMRAVPELADRGLAHRDLDFADVLIVRFEDLGKHMTAIGDFVGLPAFELPPRNVTADKPYAMQILDTARSFLGTELGIAFERELRQSEYGRACGYDRPIKA